jgi:hypothetical protein
MREEPTYAGLMIAQQDGLTGCQSVHLQFPDERLFRGAKPRSFITTFREEMKALGNSIPEVSLSLFGISWYVRNPLRYRLSPGNTYAHQMGFSTAGWSLTIDGIRTNTFENLDIALQWPVNSGMNVFVRYSDMQCWLALQTFGKLPWEGP